MDKHITVPMKKETVATLKAGDYVYLTGTVYTARDAAHKRMYEILQEGGELPIDIQGQEAAVNKTRFSTKNSRTLHKKQTEKSAMCQRRKKRVFSCFYDNANTVQ